ncbi:cupin domain-containing protein [Abyssisolibacter fermentans]|uniref:cupin domain-containing protein n=1 Tax=Abyssisolibacter fermentans TaxID=1766203 RepID=UPI00082CEB96|nr:cupin domain-containing protein [Abyssisolibacter fermentans]
MIISHERNVEGKKIVGDNAKNVLMKAVISPDEGWDGYVMRIFELEKDGFTPKHTHPWPHINYIIEGEGLLYLDGNENKVEAGSFAYVPSDELHQFRNTGEKILKFICIVPEEGHK